MTRNGKLIATAAAVITLTLAPVAAIAGTTSSTAPGSTAHRSTVIRVVEHAVTGMTEWECTWTTLLPGGHITVEGPYYDNGTNSTLTITGGTGRYTGATGSMLLHATGHPVGSEYDFIFTLTR